ncbi:hypothetical protein BATMR_21970 [Bacillus altitudinis]|nr:hypothetical protein BATMR_21970 [Bacillus altitudinis]
MFLVSKKFIKYVIIGKRADGESTFISCRLINEWYYHIQRFNVLDVEAYKEEIKSMLDNIVHFNDSIRAFQEQGYEHLNRILDPNVEQLEKISEWLERKSMYPDLEDLAKDAAKYYHKMVDKDKVMLFCEKILYFQVQVKQRDCLYEI